MAIFEFEEHVIQNINVFDRVVDAFKILLV